MNRKRLNKKVDDLDAQISFVFGMAKMIAYLVNSVFFQLNNVLNKI